MHLLNINTSYKVSGVTKWEAEQWTAELIWFGQAEW